MDTGAVQQALRLALDLHLQLLGRDATLAFVREHQGDEVRRSASVPAAAAAEAPPQRTVSCAAWISGPRLAWADLEDDDE